METIIPEQIRRSSKMNDRVADAMRILDQEAGRFGSIVQAEWSLDEDTKNGSSPVHLILRNNEFPEIVVEEQFTGEELANTPTLRTRLHRTWTRVLSRHSDALGRRIGELVRSLDEE